jgi:heterodisulfide reductase subunit A
VPDTREQIRVGVFLCRCAGTVSETIELERLSEALASEENVVFTSIQELLCSPAGIAHVSHKLQEHDVTHTVVAACSPREHEPTFRDAVSCSGRNPYLLQLTNIREHCAWVTREPEAARGKAEALLRAAIARVQRQVPLKATELTANPNVLVLGGGLAGVEAALQAAAEGHGVTLVERSPSLGGHVARYDEITPTFQCAPCMFSKRLDAVRESERIDVLTQARVEEIVGFLGNFRATIIERPRFVDLELCIGCDACMEACPASVGDPFDDGLSVRKAIDIPFPGAVPHAASVDTGGCVRFTRDEPCSACVDACPVDAVDFGQTIQRRQVEAGAIVLATGFQSFDPSQLPSSGYGRLPDVYTLTQFERLASSTGPTSGKLVRRDGTIPHSVVVIHCVGREQLGYCSGVCCEPALKVGTLFKRQQPQVGVTYLHRELMLAPDSTGATKEHLIAQGVQFCAVAPTSTPRVEIGSGGRARVSYHDGNGAEHTLDGDMVVLVTGLAPDPETIQLAHQLRAQQHEADGFVAADHALLRPAQSSVDGVYIAGCAGGPKNIRDTVLQAQASVGQALSRLPLGKTIPLSPVTAYVDQQRCSRCKLCLSLCPYGACQRDESIGRARVEQALCQGCGICVAACPSAALQMHHFSTRQLSAEINEVLRD